MKAKKKTHENVLQVAIQQNGILQFKKTFSLQKSQILKFGKSRDCKLFVPFANLANEYEIFQIQNNQVFLNVQKKYHGFIRSQNKLQMLPFSSHRTVDLKVRDFGCLEHHSYTITFKIGPNTPEFTVTKYLTGFRDQFSRFFLQDKNDSLSFGIGLTAAFIIFCGIFSVLKFSSYSPPRELSEIDERFRLSFISAKYFEQAPELLQENMSRRIGITSVTDWVRDNTLSLMGVPASSKKVNPAGHALTQKSFQAAEEYLTAVLLQRQKAEAKILERPLTSVIQIPVVLGESFEGTYLRVMDKMQLMRQAAKENEEMKIKFLADSDLDPDYDFRSRVKKPAGADDKKMLNNLAKIRVFKEDTDQEAMVKLFKNYENQALALNARALDPQDKALSQENWSGIVALPAGLEELNIASLDHMALSDLKIKNLTASEFGKTHVASVKLHLREPLIGEIEPHLVEKTVSQNVYQLRICYELAMRRNERAKGRVEWSWRIDSRGAISDVELLSSSIKDKQMTECMKSKIADWKFPRPRRGSVVIKYPFEFSKG